MRLFRFPTLVVLCTLVSAGSGFAVPANDDVATITRQSQEFSDASAIGDAKVFAKYLDEDVVFMDEGGEISTKQDIVAGATGPTDGISNKLVQSDLVIKLHGNVAVTSFTDNATVNFFGQTTQARFRSTEVWLKKAGAWKMISSQTLALPEDPPQMTLPAVALDQFAGTYDAGAKYVVKIERQGDGLISATNGGKPLPLLVEAPDVLFTPGLPRLRRVLVRDGDGKITGFNSRREGPDLHFKRDV